MHLKPISHHPNETTTADMPYGTWGDLEPGMLILGLALDVKAKFLGLGFGFGILWPWPWLGLECCSLGINNKANRHIYINNAILNYCECALDANI